MGKIKVLMLGNHSSVKGGITSVIEQLRGYDWNECEVEMKFIPTYIETNNIMKISYFLVAYMRIIFCFITFRPDVVHIHMSYKGSFRRKYLIFKLCRKFNIRNIIHLHGSEFEKWFYGTDEYTRRRIKELLRESDAFIVLGNEWNHAIRKMEPTTKTVVVSNTVHMPDYRIKWNKDRVQILFLGVLIKRKGVADLIEAIKLISDQNKIGNMKFVIAGSGHQEAELKERCKIYGLDPYVTFTGWVSGREKEKLLKESQLLVLPSYNEGLPISILEAMSYGLPVIATNVGDISSAVVDKRNGYLIQPGDYKKLAECIIAIAHHQEAFASMSYESRVIAEESFSDEMYFEKLLKLYVDLKKK